MTNPTKTIATIPGMLHDYQLESDGTVWFRPSIGPQAGQRVVVGLGAVNQFVHTRARIAGVRFNSETKTYFLSDQ
jgi:hypothetical protein